MLQVSILIPALNPDQHLLTLIAQLSESSLSQLPILIVDDGSDQTHQVIFNQLQQRYPHQVIILHHEHNQGKGAALKTGFTYLLAHYPQIQGVATLDADGQHTVQALESCLQDFAQQPENLVLGVRQFTGNVPWRSQFGNQLTSQLVRLIAQQKISDTQTGLRVIPSRYLPQLLQFSGQRFEFEFEMLLQAKKQHINISETAIPTIYLAGNQSSHFRVIRDSVAIYAEFIKFSISGLLSFLIDISFFSLFLFLFDRDQHYAILTATILARLLSAIFNYQMNHHYVFEHQGQRTIGKYAVLFCGQLLASAGLTTLINHFFVGDHYDWLTVVTKVMVDFGLFLLSYHLQKEFIFKES